MVPDPGGGELWPTDKTRKGKNLVTKQSAIRVIVVDDHPMIRSGVEFSLFVLDDIELVGEADDGEAALHLCRVVQPDVVLMDLMMPDMDGIAATRAIRALFPQVLVLVLSPFSTLLCEVFGGYHC